MLDPRVLAVLMILAGGYYVGEKVVEGIKVVDRAAVHAVKEAGKSVVHGLKAIGRVIVHDERG